METRSQIEYIATADIAPHPDNPRQDLGDLSELTDSIRANGIMENLVVVKNPDAVRRVVRPDGTSFEEANANPPYRVVIGHRRLAAARLAHVTKVPCVVRVMAPDEQIAVMLSENMQRSALTPYEEGRGFQQLSLEMGKSVKEIRDMTGFGETTIRSRLKIASLDAKKVAHGLERGDAGQRSDENRDRRFQQRAENRRPRGANAGDVEASERRGGRVRNAH